MRLPFQALPSTWRRSRLDRVASVRARIGWKALTAAEYQPDGYAFLATPNIKADDIDFDNVNYISEFRYLESPELRLQADDVLLVKDGNTLGITNLVRWLPRPATVNGSIAVIRPFGIDARFLRFVLASTALQGLIGAVKDGMGVPHLFQRDINRFPVPVPPLNVQRAIADYLDAETARIDELIAKKRRMAGLVGLRLVELAHSRTTAEGCSVPLRRHLQLVKTGSTPPSWDPTTTHSDGVDWYSPSDVGPRLELSSSPRRLPESAVLGGAVPSFPANTTIIVGIGATAGKVAHLEHPATGNQQMTCLMADAGLDQRFLSWQLFARTDEIRATAPFTTLPILNNEFLKSFPISVPSIERQRRVVAELESERSRTTEMTALLTKQIDLLVEHRQALITAAVTGESAVPGVAA